MNIRKPQHLVLRRTLGTGLSMRDFEKFEAIAKAHKVNVATYLRSIIADVIAEEYPKLRMRRNEDVAA